MRATPTNANRMLATLSCMFAVAELWEIRPNGSNPCRKIKHFREERRERFLSDEEYGRLGEVLREVEREGSERPSAIAAIRLLMLTGCRKGEILTLRWEYVDLDRGELRLPDGGNMYQAAAQKCTTGSVVACPRSPWEGPARGATYPPRGWRRPARGRGLWAHAGKRGLF